MKRIVICADGTWNRPEKKIGEDFPTNVLKVARAIKPVATGKVKQVVFYDWGVGSYYDPLLGGAFGKGIDKNIQDDYRFIVQNYDPGDELYFLGFSRGAYTVRSLCGLINNCGIIKRPHANSISAAYNKIYKDPRKDRHPRGAYAKKFRKNFSHDNIKIKFVGVWDTVGSLGIPLSILDAVNERNFFYDNKIGPNIITARHAMSVDELRGDFEPTIWKDRDEVNLKQVWFTGVHCDVGGSYKPDAGGKVLSDITLQWMIKEAKISGLAFEKHITDNLKPHPLATKHNEYKGKYRLRPKYVRKITDGTYIHKSVKERYDKDPKYRPDTLKKHLKATGGKWNLTT